MGKLAVGERAQWGVDGPPSPGTHIFLPTNGSVSARFAEAYVRALPWPAPVQVTAMMVIDVPGPPFTSLLPSARRRYAAALAALRQEARAQAWEVVAEARRLLAPHVGSVATRVQEGRPGPVAVEVARACRADLVAIGSGRPRARPHMLAERVAVHVARHAHCSVLVARGVPDEPQRLLLALDGSADAERALRWLADLRLSGEAWIHVVAVDGVGEACSWLAASGARVTATVRRGQAAGEILAAARVCAPHLLVVGARGERAAPDTGLSDLARRLVARAPCSVLVVRA
jgi:nucleotide-binding universal stress UspA family protein